MHRSGHIVCVTLAAVLVPALAAADVYRRVDAEGVTHFTNTPPRGKDRREWKRIMHDKTPPRARTRADASRAVRRPEPTPSPVAADSVPTGYDAYIAEAADLYRLPPSLIRAVIKVESSFQPEVVSDKGARGLMQLMPRVIDDMGIDDPHDPRQSILAGSRLLRILANRYEGDLVVTLAAYHAGMGNVAKYGGVPPGKRTRSYIGKVLRAYRQYRAEPVP